MKTKNFIKFILINSFIILLFSCSNKYGYLNSSVILFNRNNNQMQDVTLYYNVFEKNTYLNIPNIGVGEKTKSFDIPVRYFSNNMALSYIINLDTLIINYKIANTLYVAKLALEDKYINSKEKSLININENNILSIEGNKIKIDAIK